MASPVQKSSWPSSGDDSEQQIRPIQSRVWIAKRVRPVSQKLSRRHPLDEPRWNAIVEHCCEAVKETLQRRADRIALEKLAFERQRTMLTNGQNWSTEMSSLQADLNTTCQA
eukprot:2068391-Amphidinium_carterae.1